MMLNAPIGLSPGSKDLPDMEHPQSSREPGRPMQIIVFTSQKGGSGKTTLCGQLAVEAETSGFGPVALIDTDPQGSLADWWNARSEQWPLFVRTRVDRLTEDLEELRMMGIQTVFIDTPPTVTEVINDIVFHADLVVIPTRPSPHDLRAVGATLDIVDEADKPLIFAINGATRRARITGDVAIALSQHGTVAPATVHHRNDFATSMINGKTVMEANPKSKSADEIRELWRYLGHRLVKLDRPGENLTFETPGLTVATANNTEGNLSQPEPVKAQTLKPTLLKPRHGFGRRLSSTGFGHKPQHDPEEPSQ